MMNKQCLWRLYTLTFRLEPLLSVLNGFMASKCSRCNGFRLCLLSGESEQNEGALPVGGVQSGKSFYFFLKTRLKRVCIGWNYHRGLRLKLLQTNNDVGFCLVYLNVCVMFKMCDGDWCSFQVTAN